MWYTVYAFDRADGKIALIVKMDTTAWYFMPGDSTGRAWLDTMLATTKCKD